MAAFGEKKFMAPCRYVPADQTKAETGKAYPFAVEGFGTVFGM